ncbi:P-loop containing nucleoside triphosphate hydrolase protein [Aspergillus caelatus]|uniref:P-loop containing nucleoside triphosphate hydrolase protein n=2 Tax=Aspergillus subgen. Circumdati TaxID=2720871 RepID=A0A5N6ZKM8_9EURO|nr:P-loop containing nucleoside triphosphate hydrolase protein [Aspergillus caelatus]KAE8358184.1 P-loop containing nucleoside triphosphate hydrolase protein [Aspergillus caelatus]KAE8420645.1 P-loop containing nucleoside triphosphate hydrolase protein [Aspergillus pseudocaelatus]
MPSTPVSITNPQIDHAHAHLHPHLCRTAADPRPVVLMTCGIAGSGKSTLAHSIVSAYPSFHRLSIDSYVYSHHGLWDVDYPRDQYEEYQLEAEEALRTELISALTGGQVDLVLDFSFAYREVREEWKGLIEGSGGRWVLVFLDVDAAELRRRVRARNERVDKDGDSAFYVTEEILERYLTGFERPDGEGEIVL